MVFRIYFILIAFNVPGFGEQEFVIPDNLLQINKSISNKIKSLEANSSNHSAELNGKWLDSQNPSPELPFLEEAEVIQNYRQKNILSSKEEEYTKRFGDLSLRVVASYDVPNIDSRTNHRKKQSRLKHMGGRLEALDIIQSGLKWLSYKQENDGGWGDLLTTCEVLMPFLIEHKLDFILNEKTVSNALKFILSIKTEDFFEYYRNGQLFKFNSSHSSAFAHARKSQLVCEALIMYKKKLYEEVAEKCIRRIIDSQRADGAWSKAFLNNNQSEKSLLLTVFCIEALYSAKLSGLLKKQVDNSLNMASKFLTSYNHNDSIFYGGMGGALVLSLQLTGRGKNSNAERGLDWISYNSAKNKSKFGCIELYYSARACFQANGVSGGSKYWRAWNKDFVNFFQKKQLEDGSWPSRDGTDRKLDTAYAVRTLQTYYSYPIIKETKESKSFLRTILIR